MTNARPRPPWGPGLVDPTGNDELAGWSTAASEQSSPRTAADDRPFAHRHFALVLFVATLGLSLLLVLHLGLGRVSLTPAEVLAALSGDPVEAAAPRSSPVCANLGA